VIRILIVDDSGFMASLLTSMLSSQPDFEIIGHAENGHKAVELTEKLRPDIITMDVNMPHMDGLEATREIMANTPTPIIVVSSLVESDEMMVTFRALEEGAVAVLAKPRRESSEHGLTGYTTELTDTVRSMSSIKVIRRRRQKPDPDKTKPLEVSAGPSDEIEIVGIGSSTGGPQVLREILSGLPANFPVPLAIVNHIAEGFTEGMAKWLDRDSQLTVKIVDQGELLKPGTAYLAPEDRHFLIARRRGELRAVISDTPKVNLFRPSVTPLLQSIAVVCGKKSVGVILSGMGIDGAVGLLDIKRCGGQTFVQKEDTCVVFGMPGEAVNIGAATLQIAPDKISPRLVHLVKRKPDARSDGNV
jgi:two-component system, chemotaxis family, protein-glutamate methylesterase/glutaminase